MSTRSHVFFPYEYQENSLIIAIDRLTVDKLDKRNVINKESNSIDLLGIDWNMLSIEISVLLDTECLTKSLTKGETIAKDIQLICALSCEPTRFRSGYQLVSQGSDSKLWKCSIQMSREDFSGKAEMVFYAIRNKPLSTTKIGFASSYGDRLAGTTSWNIYIDEKSFIPGKSLTIKWEDFRISDDVKRKEYSDMIYSVELNAAMPILYLNKSIYGLVQVLHDKSKHSDSAKIRDIIFDSIAQPVWFELIIASAIAAEKYEDLEDWQKETLKYISLEIFEEESSVEVACQKLINVLRGKENNTTVIQQISLVLQEKLRVNKSIENYSKSFNLITGE